MGMLSRVQNMLIQVYALSELLMFKMAISVMNFHVFTPWIVFRILETLY